MKQLANMTPDEINALTREQLLARIRELEPPPPSDWHSWMDALLHIVLHRRPVTIEREFMLGSQPPRADFLILMEKEIVDLELGIFRIFREHNIIEFKSPDDELTERVLWKCIGYAGFYMSMKDLSPKQVTLTLIRAAKPLHLFQELDGHIRAEKGTKGIYYIENWEVSFPIQVIVTSELPGPEYAGFRSISKKPRVEDIELMFRSHEQECDPELIGFYRAFWNVSVRLAGKALEEAKRRTKGMANDVLEFFKAEVDLITDEKAEKLAEKLAEKKAEVLAEKKAEVLAEKKAEVLAEQKAEVLAEKKAEVLAEQKAEVLAQKLAEKMAAEKQRRTFYELVQDGNITLEVAAKTNGLSPEVFSTRMVEAGFTVPVSA